MTSGRSDSGDTSIPVSSGQLFVCLAPSITDTFLGCCVIREDIVGQDILPVVRVDSLNKAPERRRKVSSAIAGLCDSVLRLRVAAAIAGCTGFALAKATLCRSTGDQCLISRVERMS